MDSPEHSEQGLNYAHHHTTPHPPAGRNPNGKVVHYYGSSASQIKHHKADSLLLLFRLVTFAFSLASVVLMATDNHSLEVAGVAASGDTVKWYNFDAYRYVLAANAIICTYSLAETGLGFWHLCKGTMLMPDALAYWFDYGHDQGFAYLIFSASSAGTALAQSLRNDQIRIHSKYTCDDVSAFCTQAEIAIGMGYAAFLFIAVSSLLSGFRLARWLMGA